MTDFKNLPSPLFVKEGHDTSLWQRPVPEWGEDRRDFSVNAFMLLNSLIMSDNYYDSKGSFMPASRKPFLRSLQLSHLPQG